MKSTCSVEGCSRPRAALGYCQSHWRRFRKHGDPGPAEIRRKIPAPAACSVEGCDRQPRARGMCAAHEARWRKRGDPGPAELLRGHKGVCEAVDCDRPWTIRRLCDKHYKRLNVHGDINHVDPPAAFRGAAAGYVGVHHRLREQRGRAAELQCAHCANCAIDWAYDHEHPDPQARVDDAGRPYTVNLQYYIPLCRSCHRRFDIDHEVPA